MRCHVNGGYEPAAVPKPGTEARAFHEALPGYAPTPLVDLAEVADELGLARVALKDESQRLGLPAFKILGASWATERALAERPAQTLIAASAGNHGRAVAREAARRGLGCRVYLPARSVAARREAITAEGAEVVVGGTYEDAVAAASAAAAAGEGVEIADVGAGGTAAWVIDGYATLFAEIAEAEPSDVWLVPVGVGSLAAAAARHAAAHGVRVIGVEPVDAGCLSASLAAGAPTAVATPGTRMAGMDCAEVSAEAWPSLRAGIAGTVLVDDSETLVAMQELEDEGLRLGECGAAPLAALRALARDPACAALREAVGLGPASRVVLVATEGRTGG